MLSAFAWAVRWQLASSSRLRSSVSSGPPGSRMRSTRNHSEPSGSPICSLYRGAYFASADTAVTFNLPQSDRGRRHPGPSLPVGLADMTIDATMVGRSYSAAESYQVGREKIREFADAIGDPNPAYRGDDAVAPPTFAFVIGSRALEE